MGRNVKPGITFYRMDSNHITNKKVRLLFNEFNSDGYYIWKCLLDYGYGKWGYYFDTNDKDEMDLFASDYCKKDKKLIKEVIAGCIRRELFSNIVADSFGILTSEMMQDTFLFATSERRAKGSTFEMQQHWLQLDFNLPPYNGFVPRNILIVPPNNKILPPNYPQTRQDKTQTRQDILAAEPPTDKPVSNAPIGENTPKKNAGARPKFTPPTLQEAKIYFVDRIGDPADPRSWPEDKCHNEAGKFHDHYTGNGWKQGRGKPIVDWMAAARNWIRNGLEGVFSPPAPVFVEKKSPGADRRPSPELNKNQQEINYLYDRYREDQCTAFSVEVVYYNFLKQRNMISFSDQEITDIKKRCTDHFKEKDIQFTDTMMVERMKKEGVLEFFKKCKADNLTEIFTV